MIGIDETATLTIEVHGDGFSSLRFRPAFELDNLEVLGSPSRFEDIRFTNGNLSRTFRLSWQVRPLALGRARVRAIVVAARRRGGAPAGRRRSGCSRSPPARRSAGARAPDDEDDPFQRFFGRMPSPWRQEPRQPEVFLRAEVQPARPVVGQQVLYTIYLYTREDIAGHLAQRRSRPSAGFWVRDIPLPQQLPTDMVDIDGRRYGRVPLLKKALFPLRAGRYQIEPATIDLTVQRYDRNFFFGPPIAHPQQIRLQTAAQTIDVQPLPPAPPGFGGAVGQLALDGRARAAEVRLGEAATLTVRLSGVGNLQGVREPQRAVAGRPDPLPAAAGGEGRALRHRRARHAAPGATPSSPTAPAASRWRRRRSPTSIPRRGSYQVATRRTWR